MRSVSTIKAVLLRFFVVNICALLFLQFSVENVWAAKPSGKLQLATCEVLTGWACDADSYKTPLQVHVYVGDAKTDNASGAGPMGFLADKENNTAALHCNGKTTHGFSIPISSLKPEAKAYLASGKRHIYVYGINVNTAEEIDFNGVQPLLDGAPAQVGPCTFLTNPTPDSSSPMPTQGPQNNTYTPSINDNNTPSPIQGPVVSLTPIPTLVPFSCPNSANPDSMQPEDLNCDAAIDAIDYAWWKQAMQHKQVARADVNRDGLVTIADFERIRIAALKCNFTTPFIHPTVFIVDNSVTPVPRISPTYTQTPTPTIFTTSAPNDTLTPTNVSIPTITPSPVYTLTPAPILILTPSTTNAIIPTHIPTPTLTLTQNTHNIIGLSECYFSGNSLCLVSVKNHISVKTSLPNVVSKKERIDSTIDFVWNTKVTSPVEVRGGSFFML